MTMAQTITDSERSVTHKQILIGVCTASILLRLVVSLGPYSGIRSRKIALPLTQWQDTNRNLCMGISKHSDTGLS